eukprot:128783-Rhodomonas_salina.1
MFNNPGKANGLRLPGTCTRTRSSFHVLTHKFVHRLPGYGSLLNLNKKRHTSSPATTASSRIILHPSE